MPRPPERDADGNVVPHNHPDILDTYHVIRHIVPHDLCLDQATGLQRVESAAYSESGDNIGGMSVDIEEWMHADGLDPLHYIRDPSHGARRINVGELRAQGFQVDGIRKTAMTIMAQCGESATGPSAGEKSRPSPSCFEKLKARTNPPHITLITRGSVTRRNTLPR